MASLYKRGNRWWLSSKSPSGKWVDRSTGLRVDVPSQTREARRLMVQAMVRETECADAGAEASGFDFWVEGYLNNRYQNGNAKTLAKYLACWRVVRSWLEVKEIGFPYEVERQHAFDYYTWRTTDGRLAPGRGKRKRGRSTWTALTELKVWRMVMEEALNRDWCRKNPLLNLGIKRKNKRELREITDAEEVKIREELRSRPEWMRIAFSIAMAQGCRLTETAVLLRDVDLDKMRITFHAKGGKVYTTALVADLAPMFRKLKERGQERAYEIPSQYAREWTRFFKQIGLEHLWFHCTRATAITRAARDGVPRGQALRFFNHASGAVHELYTRLDVEDVSAAAESMSRGVETMLDD